MPEMEPHLVLPMIGETITTHCPNPPDSVLYSRRNWIIVEKLSVYITRRPIGHASGLGRLDLHRLNPRLNPRRRFGRRPRYGSLVYTSAGR
jgi:hypothetical protein